MKQFNFTHAELLELPFKTFILYQDQLRRLADGIEHADEVATWRQRALEWQRKK